MRNRWTALLCAAVMLGTCTPVSALPLTVCAEESDAPTSGTLGENLTWSFEESTGTLTISGTGEMGDGYFVGFNQYAQTIKTVIIEDGVTSIGDSAFSNCGNLTSVIIPDSVTSIGSSAFRDSDSLTSVTIPDGVANIGNSAFSYCDSLTSVTIPDSVASIGDWAFSYCDSLTSVTIPDSMSTSIGYSAFAYCKNLTDLTIGYGVEEIKSGAFSGCENLTDITVSKDNASFCVVDGILYNKEITRIVLYPSNKEGTFVIPDTITKIESDDFQSCTGITSVIIPDSVTEIESGAFSGCTGLTSVTIPDSVTEIGSDAFSECTSLTSVTIPDGVTYIGRETFSGCTSLEKVGLPKGLTEIGQYAFKNCTALESITFPDGLLSIAAFAFWDCTSLKTVSIPASADLPVDSYWVDCAPFFGCTNLEEIQISPDSEYLTSIDGTIYSKDGTILLQYAPGRPDTELVIPEGVTRIYGGLAGSTHLKSVTIPSTYTDIADESWSMTGSGLAYPFLWKLPSLENVSVSPDNPDFCSIDGNIYNKDATILVRCMPAKTEYTFPATVQSVYHTMFDMTNYSAFHECNKLKTVNIGKENAIGIDLLTVGFGSWGCATDFCNGAFGTCSSIESVNVEPGNPDLKSVDGVLFLNDFQRPTFPTADHNVLIYYPAAKADESFTVPSDSDCIFDFGMSYNTNLKKLIFENPDTEIGAYNYDRSGELTGTLGRLYQPGSYYEYQLREDFVIAGYEGSMAQEYAEENAISFESLGAPPALPPGDVNKDTVVDIMDVIKLNKYLLGSASLTDRELQAADVDGNQTVDTTDSLNIIKYVVALITDFSTL